MAIIVGEAERAKLKAALVRARAHPVPWEKLKHSTTSQNATNTGHEAHDCPPAEFVNLPFGYVVAVSFEQQPAGMCLHISVSGSWPRVAPNMTVCAMVFSALDLPAEANDVWTEELLLDGELGGRTVNAVWLVEPTI
jgi:hypothetical protein